MNNTQRVNVFITLNVSDLALSNSIHSGIIELGKSNPVYKICQIKINLRQY